MTAKVDVWMPVYYMELEPATVHLTDGEFRAYWRLIVHCWHAGGELPDNENRLASIVHKDLRAWRRMSASVMAYFVLKGGVWTHKRVDRELARARANKVFTVDRARAGAAARWKDHTPKKRQKDDASSIASSIASSNARGESNAKSNARNRNTPIGGLIESPPDRGRKGSLLPCDGQAALAPQSAEVRDAERAEVSAGFTALIAGMGGRAKRIG